MTVLEDLLELGQPMRTIPPEASVQEAVEELCRWHVRALVVGSATDPMGILCERDVIERVVRPGLVAGETTVASVMTAPLVCLPASASPEDALAYMRARRVHQVPIAGEEALLGVVSATDLRRWALAQRELEVMALESYVMGA